MQIQVVCKCEGKDREVRKKEKGTKRCPWKWFSEDLDSSRCRCHSAQLSDGLRWPLLGHFRLQTSNTPAFVGSNDILANRGYNTVQSCLIMPSAGTTSPHCVPQRYCRAAAAYRVSDLQIALGGRGGSDTASPSLTGNWEWTLTSTQTQV